MKNILESVLSRIMRHKGLSAAIAFSVLSFAIMLALVRPFAPSMALLYSRLEPQLAGQILDTLAQRNVDYTIQGDSIYVRATERDALRMSLALDGVASTGGVGFELLETLPGFGTTSRMFDATYWRAIEGELARTITASPLIKGARVHLSTPTSQGFSSNLAVSASVSLTPVTGSLSPQMAEAVRSLVSSSVQGLDRDAVAIIDARNGTEFSSERDYSSLEVELSEAFRKKVERLVDARVGRGNAIVEVAVDTVKNEETVVERLITPDSRVAISVDSEDSSRSESSSDGASVGVASNLPDGDAAGQDRQTRTESTSSRETTNYEVSQVTRETSKPPGSVQRISVAVLVNLASVEGDPAQIEEELLQIGELVTSAVGINQERGDRVTVKALPFSPPAAEGEVPAASLLSLSSLDISQLLKTLLFAIAAVVIGIFVVRPFASSRREEATSGTALSVLPHEPGQVIAPDTPERASYPMTATDVPSPQARMKSLPVADASDPDGPSKTSGTTQQPANNSLVELVDQRQSDTVEVLRSWLEESPV
ncbi:flagellar basal-body MS-ring/collar protein FliF [Fluviibacterium sp. S390]|uniref:flagellar basal-body MS-ring/collar protein FliF n=1 Tax=Fluviibacterium sp. S390 TaxID=3415139 RepID=UPI003C7E4357